MVPSPVKSIEDYRWEKRIVVTNFDNMKLDSVLDANAKGIEDRKLLFVEFEHSEYIKNTEQDEVEPDRFLNALTRKNPKAEWVLIGLDGGIKATGIKEDFSLTNIFRLIDQMPMRQSEIKGDGSLNR